MDIDARALRTLSADIGRAGARVAYRAAAVVRKSAHDVESGGKRRAAVRTGTMRDSIGVTQVITDDGVKATIGPTVNYAPHVEFATAHTAPQPFMGPAADAAAPAFTAAMAILAGQVM